MRSSWKHPGPKEITGKFVTLRSLDLTRDISLLHNISHGDAKKEAIWRFLPYGPFESQTAMLSWYSEHMTGRDPLAWTAFPNGQVGPAGITTLLSIVPAHGRAEIGHVWFGVEAQRTKINTESQYLLLKSLFDDFNYRRVEWKCDALNHASRTTAARMGFTFEGRFRQHMVVRGKNRDTDWFAMTDKDWPRCRHNFEKWLYSDEKTSLTELNTM